MLDAYDVTSFDLNYCQADISKIAAAIRAKASLVAIGMPGCGKSRLIDFLLHRPGLLEKYNLPNNLRFVRVDGDIVGSDSEDMYRELLRGFGKEVLGDGNLEGLKNRLLAEVAKLEPSPDLVVIFDNFRAPLQQTLGETFFNFLYALRNIRPRLNVSYIFMANLKLDLNGFYKMARLFDKGVDRSVCWISLLNQTDTLFSIERQLHRAERKPDTFTEADKERIYQISGGHALLTRNLTHLVLSGEASLEATPAQLLQHNSLRAACEAIWTDLESAHKNFLIDLAHGHHPTAAISHLPPILQKYGVLKDQSLFFSPLFENFAKTQEKTRAVIDAYCDETRTRLIIKMVDQEAIFSLQELPRRKRNLLCYLLANQGETCSKDQLIKIGWPTEEKQGVADQALSRQIEDLRKWLKQQIPLGHYLIIDTVWGEGYQLLIKG